MTLRRQASPIFRALRRAHPGAKCSLEFSDPLQLLIATLLSAQCADARVNRVTPALFRRYRSAADYAEADLAELQSLIRPLGLHRTKARAIRAIGRALVERFGGRVPDTVEGLTSLPFIGRKSATAVLGNGFGRAEGVTVDTHVLRVSRRLGLAKGRTPLQVERELMALFPREEWIPLGHTLILHGRKVCQARAPRCGECPVERLCPKRGVRA
ncbi:MAG: endonuclease III [Halobacteria archaeon]